MGLHHVSVVHATLEGTGPTCPRCDDRGMTRRGQSTWERCSCQQPCPQCGGEGFIVIRERTYWEQEEIELCRCPAGTRLYHAHHRTSDLDLTIRQRIEELIEEEYSAVPF